jgi:hypothetical protein
MEVKPRKLNLEKMADRTSHQGEEENVGVLSRAVHTDSETDKRGLKIKRLIADAEDFLFIDSHTHYHHSRPKNHLRNCLIVLIY